MYFFFTNLKSFNNKKKTQKNDLKYVTRLARYEVNLDSKLKIQKDFEASSSRWNVLL